MYPKVARRRRYTNKEKVIRWINSQLRKIKKLKKGVR